MVVFSSNFKYSSNDFNKIFYKVLPHGVYSGFNVYFKNNGIVLTKGVCVIDTGDGCVKCVMEDDLYIDFDLIRFDKFLLKDKYLYLDYIGNELLLMYSSSYMSNKVNLCKVDYSSVHNDVYIKNVNDLVYLQLYGEKEPYLIMGGIWEDITYRYNNRYMYISVNDVDNDDVKYKMVKFDNMKIYGSSVGNIVDAYYMDAKFKGNYGNIDRINMFVNVNEKSVVNVKRFRYVDSSVIGDGDVRHVSIRVWKLLYI